MREGERPVVHVTVDDVEAVGAPEDTPEHPDVLGGGGVGAGIGETEALSDDGDELGSRPGVARREERDVMPSPNQLFGEIRNHPLGPPISGRGDSLPQRSNLRDPHTPLLTTDRECKKYTLQ